MMLDETIRSHLIHLLHFNRMQPEAVYRQIASIEEVLDTYDGVPGNTSRIIYNELEKAALKGSFPVHKTEAIADWLRKHLITENQQFASELARDFARDLGFSIPLPTALNRGQA